MSSRLRGNDQLALQRPFALFLSFLGSGFPRCRWARLPNPCYNKVVAYRSHQVRPAAQRGAGTLTTVTLGPQPKEAIGSENMDPVVHRRKPGSVLEQFFLLCNRSIDLRL